MTAAAEFVVRMLVREQINIRLRNIDIWTPRVDTHIRINSAGGGAGELKHNIASAPPPPRFPHTDGH